VSRPLRALFFANDGLGAGHVARALGIARALRRRAGRAEILLATTSEADALIAAERPACVRWPAPAAARESGIDDAARREIAARVLRGAVEGFRPDLLITDTFPTGPHGELAGLLREIPRRALVRRSVRPERAGEALLRAGLADYHLAIVPDDPGEHRAEALPIPSRRVPPITLFEAAEMRPREEARRRLGLPNGARVILVAAGGGGDPEANAEAAKIAAIVAAAGAIAALAEGPLARAPAEAPGARSIREAPLQPLLAAFDGAFAPAGYNLAHELAKAGVPAALFAAPRPFDDQEARARRFAEAGLARALPSLAAAEVRAALAWMESAPRPSLPAGGADRAAEALLALLSGAP
jgi:predicted glycosyltransferase